MDHDGFDVINIPSGLFGPVLGADDWLCAGQQIECGMANDGHVIRHVVAA